jgi:hypothetical protein
MYAGEILTAMDLDTSEKILKLEVIFQFFLIASLESKISRKLHSTYCNFFIFFCSDSSRSTWQGKFFYLTLKNAFMVKKRFLQNNVAA